MRLLGTKTEKSHFFYLIIYQVFKPIFSIENETLRLFLQKKNFLRKRKLLPFLLYLHLEKRRGENLYICKLLLTLQKIR